jgi:hypothetical protein
MGEERTYELGITAPEFSRIEYIRPRFRLKADKEQPPLIAPALARPVQGIASVSLLTHILLGKYVDHLPLHRQAKIFRRYQVSLSEQSMVRWVAQSAEVLEPVYNRMHQNLIDGDYLQIDETPIQVMDPDYPKNQTRQAWLWPISAPGGDVVFTWSMTRGSSHLEELLEGFSGYLQSDAYSVYESMPGSAKASSRSPAWRISVASLIRPGKRAGMPQISSGGSLRSTGLRRSSKNRGQALRKSNEPARPSVCLSSKNWESG